MNQRCNLLTLQQHQYSALNLPASILINCRRHNRGFTLIEILVALAILALLGASLARQLSSSAEVYSRIELKAAALTLAENVVEDIQLSARLPLGRSTNLHQLGDHELSVELEVESTPRVDMQKITVVVRDPETAKHSGQASPLAQLTTFKGRY